MIRSKMDRIYISLLAGLIVVHAAVSLAWILWERLPAEYDPAAHLLRTLDFKEQILGEQPTSLLTFLRTTRYYPPLYYWTAVPFQIVFGPSKDAGLFSLIPFFALALLGTYGIGKRLFCPEIGLLGATILSLYPIVFGISRIFYPDLPLLAMTSLGFWALLRTEDFTNRKASLLFGAFSGLGLLVKWTYPIFLLAPVVYLIWRGCGQYQLVEGFRAFWRSDRRNPFLWKHFSALALGILLFALVLRILRVPDRPAVSLIPIGLILFHLALAAGILASGAVRVFREGFPVMKRQAGPIGLVLGNLLLSGAVALLIASPWYLANARGVLFQTVFAATRDAEARGMPGVFMPQSILRYLIYLQTHQTHFLFFLLFILSVGFALWKRPKNSLFVLGTFAITYLLLSGIRLKDPRFSLPFLPFPALLSGMFLWRVTARPLARRILLGCVMGFGFLQMMVISFGDEWIPGKIRFPETGVLYVDFEGGPEPEELFVWFKKYGYGTQNRAREDWRLERIIGILSEHWDEAPRKALVKVLGNSAFFHFGALEFEARCRNAPLQFIPGLTGGPSPEADIRSLLNANFLLSKEDSDPGPGFSIPNYEAAIHSMHTQGELLNVNFAEFISEALPDGGRGVGYIPPPRRRQPVFTELRFEDLAVMRNLRLGPVIDPTRERMMVHVHPQEALSLVAGWTLRPELVRDCYFFIHLMDPRRNFLFAPDLGDRAPFLGLEKRINMSDPSLQGPLETEYVFTLRRPDGTFAEPGEYRLGLGIWRPATGVRIHITGPEGFVPEDRYILEVPVFVMEPPRPDGEPSLERLTPHEIPEEVEGPPPYRM